ncbi:MAG: tRNA pseudouridine(38-40) synthase TruA [Candidatus Kaelpia aquatica]|nr:tRNA pseudouridine(38-40) synthase TruA [Candidatus Kaelpia aquatica]
MVLEYDGSCFSGWQRQREGTTIQGEVESGLSKILSKDVNLISSGRTDAGVHARYQVANFKTDKTVSPADIKKALNSILSSDIRIKSAQRVSLDFHARYSVKSKVYRYNIFTGEFISPFKARYFWHLPLDLDFYKMNKELKYILGKHDFINFQAKGSSVKGTERTVSKAFLKKDGNYCSVFIEADGFLYKMVRFLIGTLVEVGRGKFEPKRLKALLQSESGLRRGPTAPARGLFLWEVKY